jgi:hypothetical protein
VSKEKAMQVVAVPLDELVLDDRNARKGNVAVIVESLREFGQHRPVVVQRSSKKVIAGNHLVKAARTLGWSEVDALFVDDDDTKALRRSLADNAVGDTAKWENELLAELLEEVGPVPGYDQKALDRLVESTSPKDEVSEPIFPIVARPNEKYDYVLIVAQSEIDVNWLHQTFDLQVEQSYKSNKTSRSHVVSVERLQELWRN